MGLNTSMWAGVSGLLAHGERMGLIGNNLANVNTVGYKGSNMYFMDLLSQNVGTAAGTGQIGSGVRIGAIYGDFSQGGFETTNEALDMAIGGNGFFMVKEKSLVSSNGSQLNSGDQTQYYTRAGNFRFDKDGYLVDPHGYAVQGWEVDRDRIRSNTASGVATADVPVKGTLQDVRLDQFQIPAQATENLTVITNLDDGETDHTADAANPFFALASQWNGTKASSGGSAIADTAYAYQSTVKVYDQNGTPHDVTIYYDKVTVSNSGGKQYWEYIVTCNPLEDGRTLGGVKMAGSSSAGLLMMGTLTFDSAGTLENISAFTLQSNTAPAGLSSWTSASVDNGYPSFTANFRQVSNASVTNASNARNISLNLGVRNPSGFTSPVADASLVGTNQNNLPYFNTATMRINTNVTTNYSTSSTTVFNSQDGYPAGLLTGVSVDQDGIITGTFSNGQIQELWAVGLADFTNPWGLRREGGNLFSETQDSGQGTTGRANTGRLGSISGNALETSNVDMASEMVDMILTQRGFQANSKTITTADSMLAEVIQLKR